MISFGKYNNKSNGGMARWNWNGLDRYWTLNAQVQQLLAISAATGRTGRRRCRGRRPAGPTRGRLIGLSNGSKTATTLARSEGVPIPDERLEADPAAELTVQEAADQAADR
jgi:hypothetical protein